MQSQVRDASKTGEPAAPPREIGAGTATLLVAGSMVGSGVFTTTGFLLRDLPNAAWVLLAWLLGGVLAACGALAYAELGAALPENGGEYTLLSRIYHPMAGFTAGWVSLIVGFSAPTAAAAMAFGAYLQRIAPALDARVVAITLVVTISAVHAMGARAGGRLHDLITALDLVVIALFVVAGLTAASFEHLGPVQGGDGFSWSAPASLAVGLVYVSFSYSGWNAAVYVAGEVRAPQRTLPVALLLGTGLVTFLYVLLNLVFVTSAPADRLRGVLEIGHVAAAELFGRPVAPWISAMVAIGLASSVSAALMTGPRVYERMGLDYTVLRVLSSGARGRGGPLRAIALQATLAILMALTATFDALLAYMGFTLTLVSALTIAGVFVLRLREPTLPRPYRTWGHPFTTCIALILMLWMIVFTLLERPWAGAAGLATIGSGCLLYGLVTRRPDGKDRHG